MERVYAHAAMFAVALLAATALLGIWIGDLHGQTDPAVLRWGSVHRLSGIFTALVVVLVNSIAVTYFIGTGRWCREVVETYGLSPEFTDRAKAIKRRAFPWSVIGMLAVVGITALGGAADPSTGRAGTEAWVTPHLVGAIGLATLIAWCFQSQLPRIRLQQQLIEEVLGEVREIRRARGLEVEEWAPPPS
ncbi:MAG: hypothetical protein ACKO5R_14500 [Planctomycetaceae bacterium]